MEYLLHNPCPVDSESFKPAGTSTRIPLVVFLHGSSARGSIDKLRAFAIPKILDEDSAIDLLSQAIVLSPLCPSGVEWNHPLICYTLKELISHICESCAVDTTRIYLTGISMGGLGTWMLAARNPDMFAALVPICGGGSPVYARLVKHIPIHFFHSADDNVVAVEETDRLVAALRSEGVGEDTVLYTRYNESTVPAAKSWMVGHNCWDKAYASRELWEWLLSQSKSSITESSKKYNSRNVTHVFGCN